VVYPIYPLHLSLLKDLPARWEWVGMVYRWNPMVEMLELFRYTFLYSEWPPIRSLVFTSLAAITCAGFGYWVFRKASPNFAREI
ncbi:hypothetical protein JXA80_01515, partial [bacterium]|nr:hypothetical protein [candidate division CSSED10-310 bacterium]